jgi:hypothetical protein
MPISSVAFFHERHGPIAIGNRGQDPSHRWIRHSRNPLLGPEHTFENGSVSSRAVSSPPEANMSLAEIQAWTRAVALDPGQADYWYRLGQAYARAMQAQWSRDPTDAFTSGVQAMTAYRQAILRNPTAPFPYLAWSWVLEDVSRLAPWLAAQRLRPVTATTHGLTAEGLPALTQQLAQHPEDAAHWAKWLLQTATQLVPTTAFAHYSAGLHRLQRWNTLPAEEQQQVVQELRSALQLEPRYAAAILARLWERTHDQALVLALARGTPEERRWRIEVGAAQSNR